VISWVLGSGILPLMLLSVDVDPQNAVRVFQAPWSNLESNADIGENSGLIKKRPAVDISLNEDLHPKALVRWMIPSIDRHR
jgi:hypothetical protein